jgi:acetyl esterase/lipase
MQPDLVIPNNPHYSGMATAVADIPFFCQGHQRLLTLAVPYSIHSQTLPAPFPLLVFLQGSAWTTPNRYAQLPQLFRYAQSGMAVASIEHRDCTRGHPFPAYLQDAKCAIRFLRSESEQFNLDPDRVGFLGTSSGGNTALLVGLTGDDPRYETEDYQEYSSSVKAVCDCFGPTDLPVIEQQGSPVDEELMGIMLAVIGNESQDEVLQSMSPIYEVRDGMHYPSFLLVHGDRDELVPFCQSQQMHARLLEAGADSKLVKVAGAEHEGTFWSDQVHGMIYDFFREHL